MLLDIRKTEERSKLRKIIDDLAVTREQKSDLNSLFRRACRAADLTMNETLTMILVKDVVKAANELLNQKGK